MKPVNNEKAKMAKSKRKKISKATPTKKPKSQTKASEYASNLLELHKLQGVLLIRLKKEIS